MIASFSKTIFDRESNFQEKIQARIPQKVHTIRIGKKWKIGYPFQCWSGSPRANRNGKIVSYPFNPDVYTCPLWQDVRTKEIIPRKFIAGADGIPDPDQLVPLVTAIEKITFRFRDWRTYMIMEIQIGGFSYYIEFSDDKMEDLTDEYDGYKIDQKRFNELTFRDGFNTNMDFIRYFSERATKDVTRTLEGQLIHWSDPSVYCYDLKNAVLAEQINID